MRKIITLAIASVILNTLSSTAATQEEQGLVAYYAFDEGRGTVARDNSPNKNHGQIHGAKFVKSGDGFALKFDGKDDYFECAESQSLDLTDAITVEAWVYPKVVPSLGEAGIVGKSYSSYVLTYYTDGRCWWYISGGGNNCKAILTIGSWHHVVGTFDGTIMRLYIDGRLEDSCRSKARKISKGKAFFMGRSDGDITFTHDAHFRGMIDEVRIYNRALSTEEVQNHYRNTNLNHRVDLRPYILYFNREVIVELNFRGLGKLPEGASAEIELLMPGQEMPISKTQLKSLKSWSRAEAYLKVGDLPPGDYWIRVSIKDQSGTQIGMTSTEKLTWPESPSWRGTNAKLKVLNNLVTELLNVQVRKSGRQVSNLPLEYKFVNPREGWVFISSTAEPQGATKTRITIDSASREEAVIVHDRNSGQTSEAMRYLPAGEHKIKIWRERGAASMQLIVRAIPELIYCKFQYNPHVREYGPYDWDFLQKYVLRNVNTIVGSGAEGHRPYVEEWKKQGKKWIVECGVPGLRGEPITAQKAYDYWAGNPGFQNPLLDGVIADEFSGGNQKQYPAWTEAVRKIYENEKFKGKVFYPYCGPMHGAKLSRAFIETVINCGYKFALERYLKEQPTEAIARKFLDSALRQQVLGCREALPDSQQRMIICFGYLSAPPESLNTNPSIDYKVYMDMQFNLVANDPAFWGLYGIMEYTSGYADEEIVRWAGELYRHYCIEGNTEMLSKDPYVLSHIQNPDFDEGTKGWTLSPAQEGSIAVKSMAGYSWLQGRYPRTKEGDNFLWTKRCDNKPNIFSQEIKNLQPGRLYSLKMYTADYRDLTEGKSIKQKHAISIGLENVELIPEKCFQHIFANCYSHNLGSYNRQHRAWMNYHQKVFRAQANRARLIISDWKNDKQPGGAIGQEIIYNFIEIQPYQARF